MLIGPAWEPGYPYQHPDWALTPASGTNLADIGIATVIEKCSKAFTESRGNVSF
jgi:hypothetical protein